MRDPLEVERDPLGTCERELRSEPEPGRHGLPPALELVGGGEAVGGCVQLDGVEVPGVVGQELALLHAGRVETRLPARVRPARGADPDLHAGYGTSGTRA